MQKPDMLLDEKRFYERFYALHSDPVLLKVFEKFGIVPFRRSSVLEGFVKFIEFNGFTGETCLEIGTCKGLTAIVLSRFFDRVITVDIVDDPDKYAIAEFLEITNITFVTVANNEEKAAFIAAQTFDAAYVDGDHARDTQLDFDLVKRCENVLFHEYWPAQPAVVNLVDRLPGRVVKSGKLALWTN